MAGNGSRRPVTMTDVANLAMVSVTTVSHVINRTRPVSAATEHTVMKAVADTGYIPDNVVRSMRTMGSRTIGLAISAISNSYFGEVVKATEGVLCRAGYSLLLADTHDDVALELRAVNELLSRRVAAVLLAPSANPQRALDHARKQGVPVVLIDRASDANLDQVVVENTASTAALVAHVAAAGHSRIAMISGRAGLTTTEERISGYRTGLRQSGIRFRSAYLARGDSSVEGGHMAFTALLEQPARPTAIVVGNNAMMVGVMQAARDADMVIPKDLAVVGFDDFEWADMFHPRLTVMAQPLQAMGRQAAEMIISRLDDPTAQARTVIMNPQLQHRESCGCQPSDLSPSIGWRGSAVGRPLLGR